MPDKKIAVVILNWNGSQLLGQFLPSVLAYSDQANIYVADNASTDDSVAFVKENFPSVKIIQNAGNHGFAQGYNLALEHIEEPIYALVNSDIEVSENWLKRPLEIFEEDREIAIIQPKILDFKKKEYFEYAGAAGGFIDQYGYPFCRGRIFNTLEKDNGQYDDERYIFWASGACFFIRRNVYRQLGGFDADFFAHQEEIDLCWRANNLGYKIKYAAKSTVYHVGGATLQSSNSMKTFLNFRNSLLMLLKNLPKTKLFPIVFMRLILDGVAAVQFLFQGKFKHCFAILRAHFHFYHLIARNLSKRCQIQTESYYAAKSIVFDYFIRKIKTFR